MIDLLLDVDTGDIVWPLEAVNGIDQIRQEIASRLRFIRGEYYLDVTLGVPYIDGILSKGSSRALVEAEIKRAILEYPGVTSLEYFSVSFNSVTRNVAIDFRAQTSIGVVQASINI